MQEDYPIPATGEVPYVYFEVPTNFDEDRWVQAWEVRPGQSRRRAPRHRLPAAAPGPGTAPRPARRRTPRPRGVVTFAEGMEIPAGQTGGPPLPEGQRKPAFAE